MRTTAILLMGFLVTIDGWAEHQRVGQETRSVHQWETSLGLQLTPSGAAVWDLAVSPRLSYEWNGTCGVALAWPWVWGARNETAAVLGEKGDPLVACSWTSEGAEPRVRVGLDWSGPVAPSKAPGPHRLSGSLGVSLARDPAILACSFSVSAPIPGTLGPRTPSGWSSALDLTFQEVINDNLVWSFGLSPRLGWSDAPRGPGQERVVSWSLAAIWSLGWFAAPYSLSTGVSAGAGIPWSYSASGGRTW